MAGVRRSVCKGVVPTINLGKRKRDTVPTQRKGKYQEVYQDRRWKFIVAARKRTNPLCQRCEKKGRVKEMEEVHHTIPFDWGGTTEEIEALAFDFDNTESVCNECHDEAHEEIRKNDSKNIWLKNKNHEKRN